MSEERPAVDPLADALLAARLYLVAPRTLGGLCLRGGGPARDRVLDGLREGMAEGAPWRRLPPHIDDERLLGGVDVAASLGAGRAVRQSGLLEEAAGGTIVVPMAERLRDDTAGRLAQAMDAGGGFGLVLLDDGTDYDERAPAALRERLAFECDLSTVASLDAELPDASHAMEIGRVAPCSDEHLAELAGIAALLGVNSARATIFALSAARAHAALMGRERVEPDDIEAAVRLVLAPRATRVPPEADEQQAPPPPETAEPGEDPSERDRSDTPPDDVMLEAALAAIPPGLLEQIASGRPARSSRAGGGGKRTASKLRGKPLGARPGVPRGGARLALVDTLRAAVPWQGLRKGSDHDGDTAIHVRKDDLRVRRFEERATTVTIFCVDASGSAALARLAEAKGAVELILAQAYVKRSEVALIAFRGEGADLLLPPTRSLTRAKRALAQLPGGGGTPLASGVALARELGLRVAARGSTPFLVFLTDGSANIAADGTPGRGQAREDALDAAKGVAAGGLDALVIDIAPRPRPEAERLADAMRARYLPLPFADAEGLRRAVLAAQPDPVAA